MSEDQPTLGAVMKSIRAQRGWTLKQMSAESGIPVSTLSKVEHNRLTLTYDKLQQLGRRLKIPISDLFTNLEETTDITVTARRSIGSIESAFRIETPNYEYLYLNTDIRNKRMIPALIHIHAKSIEEFGKLVRHDGEELIYVLAGKVVIHTEFYDEFTLSEGETAYLDSSMGHAYVVAPGYDEALVLGVCSSADQDLMESLMTLHDERATR